MRVGFEGADARGAPSEPILGRFRTAPERRRNVRFVWSGDTAGQGCMSSGVRTFTAHPLRPRPRPVRDRHAQLPRPQRLQRGARAERCERVPRRRAAGRARSLARSRATWKIIAADMPIGLIVGDGTDAVTGCTRAENGASGNGPVLGREHEIARVLGFIKHQRVRGVVWITARRALLRGAPP